MIWVFDVEDIGSSLNVFKVLRGNEGAIVSCWLSLCLVRAEPPKNVCVVFGKRSVAGRLSNKEE